MAKILIVDDEKAINDLIAVNLKMVGHEYVQLYSGDHVLQTLNETRIDLVILDVMLPGRDGFEIVQDIVKRGVPVIFLTARTTVSDKVHGLETGAEDYIVKPFEAVELIARIHVILRRNHKTANEFRLDDTVVDLDKHVVTVQGQEVELTNKEFQLMDLLVQNKNIALSRERIIEQTWGFDFYGETRTVDVHIQKLRKKLNWENRIKTVYKYGYRLEV
ncbi:response regulator transcription factor [Paenibacillus sp. CF384]|uniref:response regulator transcription factor n=1 Tax=Paenibacillus sp. CF384 TaxID=1884382 RepID=UPI0008955F9C|nr:response regulator transcription factor [Paenibacillus sp. CF384]SDX55510.1 DNA-binding response regulator, OmpR family, contains REC and winged-helix (wHTH) domain [Paenibacillus sp. CF384]